MAAIPKDALSSAQKYGHLVDSIAKQYGISGTTLLLKVSKGENNFRLGGKPSSAGARGPAQFTPGSRKVAMDKFGIDPWRSYDEAFHAMALHLQGKINGSTGLHGYNPGMPSYPSYILNQDVGHHDGGPTTSAPDRTDTVRTPGSTTTTKAPDFDEAAYKQEMGRYVLRGYLAKRNPRSPLLSLLPSSAPTPDQFTKTTTTTTKTPGTSAPRSSSPAAAPANGKHGPGDLIELFYDPIGGIKRGQEIGAIGGHSDHVHVASGPNQTVRLGKLAQSMGLHVGENPHFGGVNPVHVTNSYHYKNEAIDVSGPAALMAKFYKRVKQQYGVK